MRTLILSDKDEVRMLDWLRILGSTKRSDISTTSNPREVLSLLESESIQLFIIDYSLKSMSIFNSISMSGKLNLGIITIVVSNNSSQIELINSIDKRPDIVIARPLKISDMKLAVKRAAMTAKETYEARQCFMNGDSNEAKERLIGMVKSPDFKPGALTSDYLFNIVISLETLLKVDGFPSIESFIRKIYQLFKKANNQTAAQQVANIISSYYISVDKPEKAIEETIKMVGETPSLACSLFSLAKAYAAIGDHERSNQMLELIDASKQFSQSLHSIKALNHFTLENHRESVVEQLESVRWLNLDIDDEESVFKEYSLLSDYANAYLSGYDAKLDYKLIKNVNNAFSNYECESSHEWVKEQLFEIKAKTLIKQGDVDGINEFLEDTIAKNRSLLIRNKALRERIAQSVLFKRTSSEVKDFFESLNYKQPEPHGILSQNISVALDYKDKAKSEFAGRNIDLAEEYILKARALYPDSIEINMLHVEINIFLYNNVRSNKLLEDSYKYLERIFNHIKRNTSEHNMILHLLSKLDSLSR